MKQTVLSLAMTGLLSGAFAESQAAVLPPDAVLTIESGSNFVMGGGSFGPPVSLLGESGLIVGPAPGDTGTGSHGGAPVASDVGGVTQPWSFFFNTGYEYLSSNGSASFGGDTTNGVDMTAWTVTWNTIANIPMGGCNLVAGGCTQGTTVFTDTGIGHFPWDGTNGGAYTITYSAHVPVGDPSNFGGVQYDLTLVGTVILPGAVPDAVDDSVTTIVANPVVIDVLANDTAPATEPLLPATVAVSTSAANGVTDDTNPDGTILYTPNTGPDFVGSDTFQYTVDNANGTSLPAVVTVDVQTNVAPVANDDALQVSSAVLDGNPQIVDVLANDTDANNDVGLLGGINPSAVTIVSQPATGACQANADGTITYSQTPPSVGGVFSCTYSVSDIDNVNAPLASNVATLAVTVAATQSDWPVALDPDVIPVLLIEGGVPGHPTDASVPAQSGSYFTMQVTPQTLIYTVLQPGPDGGLVIGHEQPAGNTHTGSPTGDEEISVDQPWVFFANTGIHFTKNGGISGNPDGTLQFGSLTGGGGKWIVSWNGIPEIDLGGDTTGTFPQDLGFATISCNPAPCQDQSSFEVVYEAHVPPGDPSGFGGVPYTLRLVGVVGFRDGTLQVSNGNIATQTRLLASDVAGTDPDAEVTIQCAGDCFDYTVNGVTDSSVSVVLPLAGGVPLNPVWRILDNGVWRSFDTTVDAIRSAPIPAGDTVCPAPGDAAYGDLTTGHQCIELTISDNGLNDLDPTVGIISDPSGMGSGGTAGGGSTFVDTRGSDTTGCTILTTSIQPLRRSDWWVLLGSIALLGLHRMKKRQQQ